MAGRLEGKVCVITGTASGIGAESARLFAEEGARVVGIDLDAGAEGELTIQADVSDEAQVRAAFAQGRRELGRIDVLMNNAGINPTDDGSVLETSLEAWQRVQDVNLRSVFLCCKHGIPHLLEAGGGSVINVASFVAVMGAAVSQGSYTASKGAVLSLSRELGVEFAGRGVRGQRALPGPGQHAAAEGALRQGPRTRGEAPRPHPDGPLRRAGGDRQGGALPGQRRLQLRHRLHLPGRRRALRRLPDARSVNRRRALATASSQRRHRPRPSRLNEPIFVSVSARKRHRVDTDPHRVRVGAVVVDPASASAALTSAWNWIAQAASPIRQACRQTSLWASATARAGSGNLVAVPLERLEARGKVGEQRVLAPPSGGQLDGVPADLGGGRPADLAAAGLREQLGPEADTEHGGAAVEEVRKRASLLQQRRKPVLDVHRAAEGEGGVVASEVRRGSAVHRVPLVQLDPARADRRRRRRGRRRPGGRSRGLASWQSLGSARRPRPVRSCPPCPPDVR